MTNYAWQVTGIVIALIALAGLMFIVGTGAFRLLLALTERRQPGRHQAHIIPGYDDEPGEDWSPKQEWGDDTLDRLAAPYLTDEYLASERRLTDELIRVGTLNVTGLTASAPDAPQASPVTPDLHGPVAPYAGETPGQYQQGDNLAVGRVVEFHHPRRDYLGEHIAAAWEHVQPAGENRRCGNFPMGDRGDFTESAWTKRSALDLAIDLAYDDTAAGFDQLLREVRNYSDYAASGIQERWAS